MNFAIEHISAHFSHLVITPRKKVLKHSLVSVHSGLVLVKLGKQEYAVEKNQSIWIPFDCLTSLTYFPNTKIEQVDFSVRLSDAFPQQAGYVEHSALSKAVLNKLSASKITEEYQKDLLSVFKQEVIDFKPKLASSSLTEQVNMWSTEEPTLNQEQTLVMMMREAKKRMQSGQKKPKVIDDLFAGKSEEFELLSALVFGHEL
ncbi:AraC family transcriptional regulator [Vibrio sp. 99-70-13A1]|uniref:AraC family transcriptional regulator n=1 Tax=Vibrio sp. 99-70-13A1 TaxID=2607601 RepID=UPI001493A3ED|nr:AraC family transcriptional regulator [Vibrio sp. 99-70-13A1]NOH95768.1 AraC family transcriptional regulator [Vibrio sp. 99-70-13A1]